MSQKQENKKKWTISIIAQTEEENKLEYEDLIEDINKTENEELRFVIFKFNQEFNQEGKQTAEILTKEAPDKLSLKSTEPDVSLFDKETLIKFFNRDVLDKPSDYHMLITWGHGAGLGYFYFDPETGSKTKNNPLHGEKKREENRKIKCHINEKKEQNNEYYLKNKRKFIIETVHNNLLITNVKKLGSQDEEKLRSIHERFKDEDNKAEFTLRTKLLPAEDLADILEKSFGQTKKVRGKENGKEEKYEKIIGLKESGQEEKHEKVDVLIANNCWVNMFEVGWAFKDWVDIYAAPQTVVPFGGINYNKLFKALPNIDYSPDAEVRPAIQIARNITENFLSKYSQKKMNSKNGKNSNEKSVKNPEIDIDVRQVSISVNHLKNYGKERGLPEITNEAEKQELDNYGISGIINKLSDFLIEKLQNPREKKYFLERIDIARSYCGDFTQQGVSFVDFTSFFCELIKSFQGDEADELKELYKQFFLLKEQSLLSLLSPPELFRFMPTDFYTQSPQMFSIFFPSRFGRSDGTTKFMNFYTDEKNRSKFQKASRWDDFITEYWNCI